MKNPFFLLVALTWCLYGRGKTDILADVCDVTYVDSGPSFSNLSDRQLRSLFTVLTQNKRPDCNGRILGIIRRAAPGRTLSRDISRYLVGVVEKQADVSLNEYQQKELAIQALGNQKYVTRESVRLLESLVLHYRLNGSYPYRWKIICNTDCEFDPRWVVMRFTNLAIKALVALNREDTNGFLRFYTDRFPQCDVNNQTYELEIKPECYALKVVK